MTAPVSLIVTILIIVIGKSLAAFVIVRLFRYSRSTALTISASLAQIGEFSFILASLGVGLALLPKEGSDLILAGAIFSILINPLLFAGLDWYLAKPKTATAGAQPGGPAAGSREPIPATKLSDHIVLVGHGRVGSVISPKLAAEKTPLLVIENDSGTTDRLKAQGIEAISGNACDPQIIAAANLEGARCLLVSVPDAFEGGQIVEQARRISPNLRILARSHSEEETQHLLRHGATLVVMGEQEIGKAMLADVAAQPRMTPRIAPRRAPQRPLPAPLRHLNGGLEWVVVRLLHHGEVARHQRDRQECRHRGRRHARKQRSRMPRDARARAFAASPRPLMSHGEVRPANISSGRAHRPRAPRAERRVGGARRGARKSAATPAMPQASPACSAA